MEVDDLDAENGSQNETEEDEDEEGNRTAMDGTSDVADDDEGGDDDEDEQDDEEEEDEDEEDGGDEDEDEDEEDDEDGDDEEEEDGDEADVDNRASQGKTSPVPEFDSSPAAYARAARARIANIIEGASSSRMASAYTIDPVGAAPHSAHVHAMALSADGSTLITGGSDGHVRRYDVYASMNGRTPLTQNVRHQYVDGVVKAGVMTAWWANEERPTFKRRGMDENDDDDNDDGSSGERFVSPVHSLAIQQDALWCLAGSESGNINLTSLRHEPGQLRHVLRKHTSAVSAMTLTDDDTQLLSGGWDRSLHQWDLNTGQVVRTFSGHAGQITSISVRPLQPSETWSRSNSPTIAIRLPTSPPVTEVRTNGTSSSPDKKTSPAFQSTKSAQPTPSNGQAQEVEIVGVQAEPTPAPAVKLEDGDLGIGKDDNNDDGSLFGDEMEVENNLDEALGLGASKSMSMGLDVSMHDGELDVPLQNSSKKRVAAEDSDGSDSLFGDDAASADGSPIDANTAPEVQPDADADAEGEEEDAEGEDEDAEGEEEDAEGEDDDQPLAVRAAAGRTPVVSSGIGLPGAGLSRQGTGHNSPAALQPNGQAGAGTTTATASTSARALPKPAFGGASAFASFDGDVSRFSNDIMLTSTLGGQVTLWDRRVPSYGGGGAPLGGIGNGHAGHKGVRALPLPDKTPPWCTSACWNSRGDKIYVGRRNETIDEWDLRMLPDVGGSVGQGRKSDARLSRSLRMPTGSGPVTSVLGMPNGRHLVCGSYDNVRLWDTLADPSNTSSVPFRIVAGHHGATISDMLLDPTARFLFTASGDRGWMSNSTESVILHEIRPLGAPTV